jgi:hypothetical protein
MSETADAEGQQHNTVADDTLWFAGKAHGLMQQAAL